MKNYHNPAIIQDAWDTSVYDLWGANCYNHFQGLTQYNSTSGSSKRSISMFGGQPLGGDSETQVQPKLFLSYGSIIL